MRDLQRPRLTPADAGRTTTLAAGTTAAAAHPRRRGEDVGVDLRGVDGVDSPPQTRGGQPGPGGGAQGVGLTPADAGRTGSCSGSWCGWPAHPRRRGEDPGPHRGPSLTEGSPPQTRGGRLGLAGGALHDRLTPADAGRTSTPSSPSSTSGAHPRRRGEDSAAAIRDFPAPGSPPQTRGGRTSPDLRPSSVRLTPADAGRTTGCPGPTGAAAAHPRRRGEDVSFASAATSCAGSPPQTRGGQLRQRSAGLRMGLTPADAGRT